MHCVSDIGLSVGREFDWQGGRDWPIPNWYDLGHAWRARNLHRVRQVTVVDMGTALAYVRVRP